MPNSVHQLKKAIWLSVSEEAEHRDPEYWLSKTPHFRLRALERLRQLTHGYDPNCTPKMQRVFRIAKPGEF